MATMRHRDGRPHRTTAARTASKEIYTERPQDQRWLILAYRIPAEPTRLRAAVWRRLKTLGAVYLHGGIAVVPHDAVSERGLRVLQREIGDMSGTSILLSGEALAGGATAVDAFNAARNDEYNEIIGSGEDFLRQIDGKQSASKFTLAELAGCELDLAKLQKRLSRVRCHDVMGAEARQPAELLVKECERALERYATRCCNLE
jgi:hypothetical protein